MWGVDCWLRAYVYSSGWSRGARSTLTMRRVLGGGGQKEVRLTDEIKPGSKKWSAVVANLRKIPFLTDLGGLELNVLAHELTLCRYSKGEAIVTQGDEADGLYQVHTGGACVEIDGEVVKQYATSEFFGELALLSAESTKRNATVIATEKVTQCLRMSVADFQHLQSVMAKDSEAAEEQEDVADTSAADVAAAAEEQAGAQAGGFSHGHKAALRKCSALRAELAAAQRRLREQAEELNAVRTEAAQKHEQLRDRMQEMDEELQAAVEVAHKLGEETQRQGYSSVRAQLGADSTVGRDVDTVRELREENAELRSENEKLRLEFSKEEQGEGEHSLQEQLRDVQAELLQTQAKLEERIAADHTQEVCTLSALLDLVHALVQFITCAL
eukprot:COSAG02_NODE_6680_length_3423_cov_1.648917_2_plen_385_part_00